MFVLILATLLLPVRGNIAPTSGSVEGKTVCQLGFCITLSDAEITAEAGLCVVIPCSFTTGSGFTPQSMVWFKCETSKPRCAESEMIFHSVNYSKGQSGFRGRVSLLEPDVSQKNCGIIINDLTESDSGSYQIRVNVLNQNGNADGFLYPLRATVSVKGLTQKPTVMIPPLTEGQQTTLTCTAPGLCSGSDPEITWMWRGAGEKDSHITGNITAFKTENLTAVTQRHSSTLTFNVSAAQHHGTNVTCEISFSNNITTEETVTLNVTTFPKIFKSSGCKVQSEILTCVCISEAFPLPTIKWPLLKNHTEFSVTTTVSNRTVNSTVTLSVKDHSTAAVECVSSNEDGEAKENLNINVITSEGREASPKILKSSGCKVQSEILTCVCISEAFPLPTIKWPLLKNHTEFSVTTSVSNCTVNSTVTLSVKDHSTAAVECVSSNEDGEAKENLNLNVITSERREDPVQQCDSCSLALPLAVAAVSLIVNTTCCVLFLWNARKKAKPNQEDTT